MEIRVYRVCVCGLFLLAEYAAVYSSLQGNGASTELAREQDDRPLLFATLGGGMVAVNQLTGNIIWSLKDEPVVKVPNESDHFVPQFLPDPRHGSLYMFGERRVLKKLPLSIPQLVARAPCRSSDGFLYTGRKVDTWFLMDRRTGSRKPLLGGFDKSNPFGSSASGVCPIDPKEAVYLARTEYNVLMYDSLNTHKRWNVTFYDYSSNTMGHDMTQKYGIVHFTSTSSGRLKSFDRKSGEMAWSLDMQSPVVAAYLLDPEGLISVPFTALGDDTLDHIVEDAATSRDGQAFRHSNIELFPSLYIGEHLHGLYALPSLVDKSTFTISTQDRPLLLEGPQDHRPASPVPSDSHVYRKYINVHYKDADSPQAAQYMLLGHYAPPEYAESNLRITTKDHEISFPLQVMDNDIIRDSHVRLIIGPSDGSNDWYEIQNETNLKLEAATKDDPVIIGDENSQSTVSVGVQTDYEKEKLEATQQLKRLYRSAFVWINQNENKGLKLLLIILSGVVVMLGWYLRSQAREFRQLSQNGSRNSRASSSSGAHSGKVTAVPEELDNGAVRVGKIIFHPEQVLGKGCDGTFVYRGTFENRDVAVKRLLPECFTFADREVALLTESDTHANVVRYFCMEQDKLFRYIALELCAITLQQYVQERCEQEYNISPLEVLRQATAGLAHLHQLDIVHRDIKPHNVLLSFPSPKAPARAMISDFGLCKKLNIGRSSFSRRSGVTGTDGWIAPEMIKGERTTTSVDIFSLGCVYHYVLSRGQHPYGDVLERQANILKGRYSLSCLSSSLPEQVLELSVSLLKGMLSPQPSERPPAGALTEHPLFWNTHKILAFLQDVSDRVEKDPPGGMLEQGGGAVLRGDWRSRVSPAVAADLRRYRAYQGDSVRDLLRALRNKKHHYRELSEEARESLGSVPEGFTLYWLSRFPRLLLHVWLQMQQHRQETSFSLYYHSSYLFSTQGIAEHARQANHQADNNTESNSLFIKSKHYFSSSPKHNAKYKSDAPYKYQDVDAKDWRAGPRLSENDIETIKENEPLNNSPSRVLASKDARYKGRSPRGQNHYSGSEHSGREGKSSEYVSKPRNRKKEEQALVWTLPNQAAPSECTPAGTTTPYI